MKARNFFIFLALGYVLLAGLSVFSGVVVYRVAAASLGVVLFAYMLFQEADFERLEVQGVVVVILLLFAFSVFSFEVSNYRSAFSVLVFVGALGVSWFAIANHATFYLYEIPFYLFLAVTVVLFVFFGFGPVEFNTVLSGYSRNGYSAILLALAGGYIFSRVYREKSVSLILMLLVLASSFPLYGRSGIAMAFALVLIVLFYKSVKASMFLALLGFCCLLMGFDYLEGYILRSTNFSAGVESPRAEMLAQYISGIDVSSLFFGVDLATVPIIVEYNGNPHNAFVLLHSYYGVASILIFMFFIASLCKLLIDGRYMFFVLAVLFLFRAFFDIIYLFGLFDYLVFPLLFYVMFSNYFQRGLRFDASRVEGERI